MSFVDLKTKLLHLYLTNIILQLLSERLWYVSESRRAKLHSFRASISYANLVIFFVQYKLYSIYLFTITINYHCIKADSSTSFLWIVYFLNRINFQTR